MQTHLPRIPPLPCPFESRLYFQTQLQFHLFKKDVADLCLNPTVIIVTATHVVIYQELPDNIYSTIFFNSNFIFCIFFFNYQNVYISSFSQSFDWDESVGWEGPGDMFMCEEEG